jgi:hypothetical protein
MAMSENEAIKKIRMMPTALFDDEADKAKEMAIQALEKQIAKKPYSDQKGLLDVKMWNCPVCKKEVISDWNRYFANDYCHNCGQKLDWQ